VKYPLPGWRAVEPGSTPRSNRDPASYDSGISVADYLVKPCFASHVDVFHFELSSVVNVAMFHGAMPIGVP